MSGYIREYLERHYRHFNAAALLDAARGYLDHVERGGRMMVTLAGAMSTAELGRSLAEMIRQDRVHAICCTGANLEEDIYNLVAHQQYVRIPDWRNLTPRQEKELEAQGLARVTDTCIPEQEAIKRISGRMLELWQAAEREGRRHFPHEFAYQLLEVLPAESFEVDPRDSWLLAAAERKLPIFVPGWEDSTTGNAVVSEVFRGNLASTDVVRSGLEYMSELTDWYARTTMGVAANELPEVDESRDRDNFSIPREEAVNTVGFFQIGGGIAGDFPICVVPMIQHDIRRRCPYWDYFCQISDSTTSYGSYSGAFPSEKITWSKLDVDTPSFMIESDATIVAPLIFGYVLDW